MFFKTETKFVLFNNYYFSVWSDVKLIPQWLPLSHYNIVCTVPSLHFLHKLWTPVTSWMYDLVSARPRGFNERNVCLTVCCFLCSPSELWWCPSPTSSPLMWCWCPLALMPSKDIYRHWEATKSQQSVSLNQPRQHTLTQTTADTLIMISLEKVFEWPLPHMNCCFLLPAETAMWILFSHCGSLCVSMDTYCSGNYHRGGFQKSAMCLYLCGQILSPQKRHNRSRCSHKT